MKKTTHTPFTDCKLYVADSWHQDYDTMIYTRCIRREQLNMPTDRTIAHVDGMTLDEADAFAKLFAAAPETAAERDRLRAENAELVDACKWMHGLLGPHNLRYDEQREAHNHIAGLIQKAEGGKI